MSAEGPAQNFNKIVLIIEIAPDGFSRCARGTGVGLTAENRARPTRSTTEAPARAQCGYQRARGSLKPPKPHYPALIPSKVDMHFCSMTAENWCNSVYCTSAALETRVFCCQVHLISLAPLPLQNETFEPISSPKIAAKSVLRADSRKS